MKIEEINNKKDFNFNAIYLWTNLINGKHYVGQAKNFYDRMRDYISGQEKNRIIGSALEKYGFENFDISILEKDFDYSLIDEKEQYWMDYYQSYNLDIGYNLCKKASSTKGYHHTEEAKKKMSEIAKKRFKDHPEYIKKGKDNPNYGKYLSKDTKEKMSKSRMGNQNAKGRTWNLSQETKDKISKALKGKPKTYVRKLSQETKNKISKSNKGKVISEDTRKKLSEAHKGKTAKKVLCVEINVIYDSITEASKYIGKDGSSISKCCRGKQKTCGGYHWKYVEE